MDQIWWKQIPKANRFLHAVTNTLLAEKSVILFLPPAIPWRQTLYTLAEEILRQGNPNNQLCRFHCPPGDPGEYLFNQFCPGEKRAIYRRGTSYAAFLARTDGLVLNNRYLWVQDVPPNQLDAWTRFLVEYQKNLSQTLPPAVFLLETTETAGRKAVKGVQNLPFSDSIDANDRIAFCALASTEGSVSAPLRPYLAELVSNLCDSDVELCAACIQRGEYFLQAAEESLTSIARERTHSDGTPFDTTPILATFPERLWESQIRILFPILQAYRSNLIHRYWNQLARALPVENAFQEVITDPQDLELGMLVRMVGLGSLFLPDPEYERLVRYRDARNNLAHMKPVDFSVVHQILTCCL